MTITLYQASVPVFRQMLGALRGILAKAQSQAEAMKVAPEVLLQARLYPNMFPLVRQVQIATDFAKGCPSRLAGLDPPRWEDVETSFPELLARIDRTLEHLATLKPEQIDGQEGRTVSLTVGGQPMTFQGLPYLLHFALPNFYFHLTTAYAILRHNGIDVGKRDFVPSVG
jgi:hypothetical protein